ncbi:3-hydroxyacyl-CoA dehydrogenase (FadB) [Fructobacillus evanidus]|nr:3-hydroxyacyl-CoA dehydrogenase (FadB) [Fructobacillus sp. LMG 32999]CAK1230942.1 3-hydroxyacyl-CoA dehydrogenase (FadB) [Fructobacillus sp. LMG 32999]CAK1236850.1 3-hydroxyacyl-CoA dehydrogenase (FadB) [Fructobacillus sp. LMG 32999]CAK1241804.1 3-hydroxyacyl-CoA dehydrogenase (FadB) [Fructobacillus sp. LMG 32999]CAK1243167.1 3-hydroxyacyl-CoA dehydrogenase (FadB) [Fructobacillus sp. LMG 32999]
MTIKNVVVAGGGVLGSQIAFQSAFTDFNVTVYGRSEDSLKRAKERLQPYVAIYNDFYEDGQKANSVIEKIRFTADLAEAVKNADLVIEAIPESLPAKESFYRELSEVAPAKTIFATNSSTFIPSQFVEYVSQPERLLAIHFANQIWANNTAEIMGHAGTNAQYVDDLVHFARDIRMVPFRLNKEQHGYLLNSLLVPFLEAGQKLWADEVADPQTIDKAWMIATGAPMGPFAILDVIGLNTPYNLALAQAKDNPIEEKIAALLKERIDQNEMGLATQKGFYEYPKPVYQNPDFLK